MAIALFVLAYVIVGVISDVIYFKVISDYKYDPEDVEDLVGAILIMTFWPLLWIVGGGAYTFYHLFKRVL